MSEKKWQWLLLVLLMAVAPILYSYIQAYWAFFLVPVAQFFSVTEKVTYLILIILMNFTGALIVASLLSLPLGYAVKERPCLFGALLSLAPLVFMLWVVKDESNITTAIGTVRIGEYLSVVLTFTAMARFGAYLRKLTRKAS